MGLQPALSQARRSVQHQPLTSISRTESATCELTARAPAHITRTPQTDLRRSQATRERRRGSVTYSRRRLGVQWRSGRSSPGIRLAFRDSFRPEHDGRRPGIETRTGTWPKCRSRRPIPASTRSGMPWTAGIHEFVATSARRIAERISPPTRSSCAAASLMSSPAASRITARAVPSGDCAVVTTAPSTESRM